MQDMAAQHAQAMAALRMRLTLGKGGLGKYSKLYCIVFKHVSVNLTTRAKQSLVMWIMSSLQVL